MRIDEKGLSRLDRLSGKIEKTLRLPGEKWSVAFREDKRLILLPKQAGDLLVVNALKLQITARFSLPGGVKRHIWLEDGRLLLVGSSGELWRVSIK